MKKRPRGTGSVFLRGDVYWIRYYRNGKGFSESAHTNTKTEAQNQLRNRIAEITHGNFITPQDRRISVDEVYQLLIDDYRMNNRASLKGAEQRWEKRLKPYFGGYRATAVSTEMLNKFVLKCQEEKLSNGTINRDLAALKRAFNLAYRSTPRKVQQLPVFPHLKEAPPRKGFVEESQYRELTKHATELWMRSLLCGT